MDSDATLKPLWDEAQEAADRGDHVALLSVWKCLIEKGVWSLAAHVGLLYERGADDVPRDMGEALYWYRKAVFESDDAVAHLGIGRAYYFGDGAERNVTRAVEHFRKASIKAHPEGDLYMGFVYYAGLGLDRDLDKAEHHFLKTIQAGYFAGFIKLARIAFDRHQYLRGAKLVAQGLWVGLKLVKADASDPRLLGIKIR